MIQLSRYLQSKRPQEQRCFLSAGLAVACQNIENSLKKRTTDVNVDKINEFIQRKIDADNSLLQAYTGIKLIAQKFESAPRGHYELSDYQVYVTAQLASSTEPTQALKLGAGQGKSFICLKLVAYHV